LKGAVRFLTDFADQAVVLPLAAVVAVLLLILGWRRGAVAWVVAVCGTLGTMLLLKITFYACGDAASEAAIHSPSGHTAAAAVTYGGLATLFGFPPPVALAVAAGSAVAFGISRLVLGFHNLHEVLLGGVIGIAGAAVLAFIAGRPPPRLHHATLVAALVIGLVLFHGAHVHAESAIGRLAMLLDVWPLSACRGG
jgi:membrane-associated phospholipid phosphatase